MREIDWEKGGKFSTRPHIHKYFSVQVIVALLGTDNTIYIVIKHMKNIDYTYDMESRDKHSQGPLATFYVKFAFILLVAYLNYFEMINRRILCFLLERHMLPGTCLVLPHHEQLHSTH